MFNIICMKLGIDLISAKLSIKRVVIKILHSIVVIYEIFYWKQIIF